MFPPLYNVFAFEVLPGSTLHLPGYIPPCAKNVLIGSVGGVWAYKVCEIRKASIGACYDKE